MRGQQLGEAFDEAPLLQLPSTDIG